MTHSVDTALLRTFLEVQKTRHFGRAADNLYLTQSAVSFRIRQLEQILGVKLFERFRHNIQLTAAGERLIPHAKAVLTAWQRAELEVGLGAGQRLQLALGATPNVWDVFLQSSLPLIAHSLPAVALRADMLNSNEISQAVLSHTLDLAVLFDPPKAEELVSEPVAMLELQLVSNRPDTTLAKIEEHGYVMLDWGTAFNIQQAKLFAHPLTPILHTAQSRIALDFLLQAGGSAYLPQALVAPYLGSQLFNVEDAPEISRQMFAVSRKDGQKREAVEAVLNLLKQHSSAPPTTLLPAEE